MDVVMANPTNNIISVLTDPEGRNLGTTFDLPQDAGPKELHALVNAVLQNVGDEFVFLSSRTFFPFHLCSVGGCCRRRERETMCSVLKRTIPNLVVLYAAAGTDCADVRRRKNSRTLSTSTIMNFWGRLERIC